MSSRFRLGLSLLMVVCALGWVAAGVEASPPDQGPVVHTVRSGESLSGIAGQYGISMQAIMQANRLKDPQYIFAGQKLVIPGAVAQAAAPAAALPVAPATPVVTSLRMLADAPVTAPAAPVAATAAPSTAAASDVYTVRPNDTLGEIASRFNTSVDTIAAANGISPYRDIYIGQKLRIPGAVIQPNQPPASVASSQPTAAPAGASSTASTTATYTVQPGDTLSLIAMRHGVSYPELAAANNLANSGFIQVGQTLTIPGKAAAPAPASQAAPAEAPAAPSAPRPQMAAATYTVESGDTMSKIADQFDVPLAVLVRMNNISNPRFISVGRTLTIPKVAEPGNPPWGDKKIEVDISMQHMFVWEGDVLVETFVVSTGLGAHQTQRGNFHVKSKEDMAYSTVYDLYMPTWLGIYDVGTYENGIHGLPTKGRTGKQLWAGVLGSPVSFGCVVMGIDDGKWLYDWAEIGTAVEIKD